MELSGWENTPTAELFDSGKLKPDKIITIPLSHLQIAQQLMPTKMKSVLDREGINIKFIGQLSGENFPKESLLEVESNQEKLVISVE